MLEKTAIGALFLFAAAPASATQVFSSEVASDGFFATYKPATGGITFHNPNAIFGVRLSTLQGSAVSGATDLNGAASGPFGGVTEGIPNHIDWVNLRRLQFDTAFAGNVIRPGTPPSYLSLRVVIRLGDSEILRFIPEPNGLLLALTATTLVAAQRRR